MPRRTRSLYIVVCICDIIDIPTHMSSHHLISYIQDYLCNSQLIQGRVGSQLRFGSRFANSFLVTVGKPSGSLALFWVFNFRPLFPFGNELLHQLGHVCHYIQFVAFIHDFWSFSSQAARYELLEARLWAVGAGVETRCWKVGKVGIHVGDDFNFFESPSQGFTSAFSWYSS